MSAQHRDCIQLIYSSRATKELSESALLAILDSAVRHNRKNQVTGMLIFCAGTFLQVLEGTEAAVEEVMSRLRVDPRHTDITVLAKSGIAAREFGSWSMGFQAIDRKGSEQWPGYAPIFSRGFSPETVGARPGLALEILLALAKSLSHRENEENRAQRVSAGDGG